MYKYAFPGSKLPSSQELGGEKTKPYVYNATFSIAL